MTTGLKQMVDEAMSESKPPVEVSGEAVRALAAQVREWSGWSDARFLLADPRSFGLNSRAASVNWSNRTFIANPETLVLNPHRVLLTITPFRLRQEAVLTGALLHEAGHCRHTLWVPRTPEQSKGFRHADGTLPTDATIEFARLFEEPRIDGLMARDADKVGAFGLGWTMRASAVHLLPGTVLSVNPDQKVMDLITSWALRAGRQIAFNHYVSLPLRHWVQDFTSLVHRTIEAHLRNSGKYDEAGLSEDADGYSSTAGVDTRRIMDLMLEMIRCEDDRGSTMIDLAREALALLFPETDPDDMPEAGGGCSAEQSESEEGDDGEGDEAGAGGEGNTEPEDDGSGEDPGEGDTGEGDQPDGDSDSEGEDEGDQPGSAGGASDSTEGEQSEQPVSGGALDSELAQALAEIEAEAKDSTEEDCDDEAENMGDPGHGAGVGGGGSLGEGWRLPTPPERTIAKGAERFLRGIIAPSESSKIMLTDSPASTVDGAALAAWKAGGQVNTPHFFKRTRREVEPSPPVKIALLVDVSASMEELQQPSAILSWALASAALDLRNFAGRGQQIESTLIHWGSKPPRVIQKNGQTLPGIREFPCNEGTSQLHAALALVEEELPGFFDHSERPVNRLLVQFTDWELSLGTRNGSIPFIRKALAAGVNMITVAPHDYSERNSDLHDILKQCPVQRGASTLLRYNQKAPEQVWETAAAALL